MGAVFDHSHMKGGGNVFDCGHAGKRTVTVTLVPSGYTGLTNLSTNSSYPIENGYTDASSTTYARLKLPSTTAQTGYLYYTFDCSTIPSRAKIQSISCDVKIRVNNTSYANRTACQLYTKATAKGSSSSFDNTSSSNIITLSSGDWTRSELDNLRLYIAAAKDGDGTGYIYFYGATVTITYTA